MTMSSDAIMVINIEVLEHMGNSDHNIILWDLVCDIHLGKSKVPHRQYHKADYNAMREWISKVDWDREFNGLAQVEEMWNKF